VWGDPSPVFMSFLPDILYYNAIELFLELVGVHVGKDKLIRGVDNEPGSRLAMLLVEEHELLKDSGELCLLPGLVA